MAPVTSTQPSVKEISMAPEKHGIEDEEMLRDAPPQAKKQKTRTPHVLYQFTLRKPSWTYLHLSLFSTSNPEEVIDILTIRRYLTSALSRFLGLHGTAIPVDILKLEGREAWLRVPREDGTAVHEALSGWAGGNGEEGIRWVVKRRDEWLTRLVANDGQDLFAS